MMDAPDLEQLMNLDKGAYVEKMTAPTPRLELVREAACSLGARGGLAKRSEEIRIYYDRLKTELDGVFPFQTIMLEFGVLPPVITKSTEEAKQVSPQEVSYAGVTYSIAAPARLVTTPPNWREYMYKGLSVGEVELPAPNFMPENEEERKIWGSEVKRCWRSGIAQANETLEYNQKELRRDFLGMLRYKLLALKGEVRAPLVITNSKTIDGGGNTRSYDVRTYKIEDQAGFK